MRKLAFKQLSLVIASLSVLLSLPTSVSAQTTSIPTYCQGNSRVLAVVAHQDDDLLFLNPDIQAAISAGKCVQSVYVTAGDAGNAQAYWALREKGIRAAYAQMAGVNNSWTRNTVNMNNHALIRDTLKGNPKITVTFMRLPDGKIPGTGFARTDNKTLKKLWQGTIINMPSVDGKNSYTKSGLEITLAAIMNNYRPTTVRTLNTHGHFDDGDHTDHVATAFFTKAAVGRSGRNYTLISYQGYPMKSLPSNLTKSQTYKKQQTFFVYERTVDGVCQSTTNCGWDYKSWLSRRYKDN